MRFRAVKVAFMLLLVNQAVADSPPPQPLVKSGGSCPTGYVTSGNYCRPLEHARFAIAKQGTCPTGYVTSSSNYCLAMANGRYAMPKVGSCPTGFISSGSYCLEIR